MKQRHLMAPKGSKLDKTTDQFLLFDTPSSTEGQLSGSQKRSQTPPWHLESLSLVLYKLKLAAALQAASLSGGKAAKKSGSPGSKTSRSCCNFAAIRKWWSKKPIWLCFCAFVAWQGRDVFSGFGRSLHAMGGAASAASDILEAGANVTIQVSSLAVHSFVTASAAAHEFWHGVDVLNVNISRIAGRIASPNCNFVNSWILHDDQQFPDEAKVFASALLLSLQKMQHLRLRRTSSMYMGVSCQFGHGHDVAPTIRAQ